VNYKVLLHESKEGFSVSCPGLPGCWSQGQTEEEALENIQDAIREYLAAVIWLKGKMCAKYRYPFSRVKGPRRQSSGCC